MKRIYIFCSVLLCLLLGSCKDYDDSAIQDKLNDLKSILAGFGISFKLKGFGESRPCIGKAH